MINSLLLTVHICSCLDNCLVVFSFSFMACFGHNRDVSYSMSSKVMAELCGISEIRHMHLMTDYIHQHRVQPCSDDLKADMKTHTTHTHSSGMWLEGKYVLVRYRDGMCIDVCLTYWSYIKVTVNIGSWLQWLRQMQKDEKADTLGRAHNSAPT